MKKRNKATERYSDLSFHPGLTQNGDLTVVKDNDSIKQAIFTLFHTIPGSRVMAPAYGASLQPFLFEPFDESTANDMLRYIREAIDVFEPRINTDSIDININEANQSYEIDLYYTIIDTQVSESIAFRLERL